MKNPKEALVIVDMQNDFGHRNGTLYVTGGETIITHINTLIGDIRSRAGVIIATRDWHPENHISFASRHSLSPFSMKDGEMKWPDHCVAETWGSEFVEGLDTENIDHEVKKAFKKDTDSYSGFGGIEFGENQKSLEQILKETNIKVIHIVGLATDYCVKATALDAKRHGFETIVHMNGIRAVSEETGNQALEELRLAGVKIIAP